LGAGLLCAALLLGLFLFRPGVGKLKNRIAAGIGQALQREVEIGSVHLHLLPSPGFDLDNFIVHDDPAFSAEPMLRAQEVTASLRLTALLRAHLEVSSLNLTEPSLNLVRNAEGHWNIESVLEHNAQTSAAPTGQKRSLTQPAFPYIQADRGRINFKLGPEKTPFALSEADYAFWQDSDSSWGMRLKAVPIRTDFNISDTGVLRASGTWQRAGSLRETPLQFSVQWERAQLGMVTKLASGADRGWRGTVRTSLNLAGEPNDLRISADASIDDFRRFDLAGGDPLRVGTHCEGRYSSVSRDLHDLLCVSPVAMGKVTLSGNVRRIAAPAQYSLTLSTETVPMSALLALARRAKKDLPADLEAEGSLTLRTKLEQSKDSEGALVLEGYGATHAFKLHSSSMKTSLALGEVPLQFTAKPVPDEHARRRTTGRSGLEDPIEAHQPRLIIGPFHMDPLAGVSIQGVLTKHGYSFAATGDSEIKRLLLTARTLGVPSAAAVADGTARLDVRLAGDWRGFPPPQTVGTAQIHNIRIELRALNGPVEVASAAIRMLPDRLDIQGISATLADSHWKGSLTAPRGCSRVVDCPISFDLQADEIVPEKLRLFADPSRPSPWYRVLSPGANPAPSFLTQLRASGKIKVGRFVLPGLVATHVVSTVKVEVGRLHLSDLTAETLSGKHTGTWDVDFTAQPPLYAGNGSFKQVALAQLGDAMRDAWLSGTGNGDYRIEARGHSLPELLDSAAGSLQFDVHAGEFNHVILDDDSLKIRRCAGVLVLKNGKFELQHGILDSASGNYTVSGSASWSRQLDITMLSESAPTIKVTGLLESPEVAVEQLPPSRATLEH
jgi:AsmA protein